MSNVTLSRICIIVCSLAFAGCAANNAGQTLVINPKSMQDAMKIASEDGEKIDAAIPQARIIQPIVFADRPVPAITPPDIRMAYVYSWVDREGTMHFPSWTAVVVRDYQWVVPGLGVTPLTGGQGQPAPNPQRLEVPN
jgi:hypothetical protein